MPSPAQAAERAVGELDDRVGIAKGGRKVLDHIFPDHWSFMLGELAMYSFIVLVATGIFLTLYYVPSGSKLIYHGVYRPLDGQQMTDSYASTLHISFGVRAGLLVRQMHHWAADVFIGSIIVHMLRIFFTSAYRRPRDTNWVIGTSMLLLAIFNGYLGYSMPDDLMSGSGVRIGYSIMESIPFVGSYLVFFIFDGPYPRESVFIPRFFIVHVLIIPLLIIGLLGAHLMLVMRQKHTQWPGKHRTYRNVVGHPLWPNFAAKSAGLMLMVAGVLGLMGAFFQIDPIWQFGPYAASHASDAAQPDWYMLWLEGALRLMPNWEISGLGHTFVAVVFIPAVLMPALTFLGMYLLPAVERRLVPGQRPLQLLIPPRRRPVHTAVGVGAVTFYGLLTVAGTDDVLANFFHISLPDVVMTLQIAVVVLPFVAGTVAWLLCHDLERTTVPRVTRQPAVVVPSPRGGYELKVEEPTACLEDPDPIPVPASLVPSPVKDPPGSRASGQGDLDGEFAGAGDVDGDGRARHRSAERRDQAQER